MGMSVPKPSTATSRPRRFGSIPDALRAGVTENPTGTAGGYGEKKEQVSLHGMDYTKLTVSDAGAGNFYDVTSYRMIKDSQCYALEYTIHSTNIGNYSPDQGITEFDKTKIQTILESIVKSFSFKS